MFGKVAYKIVILEGSEYFFKIPIELKTIKNCEIGFSSNCNDPMLISGMYNSAALLNKNGDVTKINNITSWIKESDFDIISISEIDVEKECMEEFKNAVNLLGKKILKNSSWFRLKKFFNE